MTPEQMLWVSDYVDAARLAARAEVAEAFTAGRELGEREGALDYERCDNERFRLMIERYRALMREPRYAQLDRRRHGPGGRESQIIRRPLDSPAGGALVDGRSAEAGQDCTVMACGWPVARNGLCRNGHTAADRIRDRMISARLDPDAGIWPKDLRRRARRRGDPDPFHIRHGPGMTCTACSYWGLECPPEEEAKPDG